MSFEAALILAFFIVIVTMVGMGALIGSRKQAAREEELKSAASARGWQFESKLEKGYRVHRFTGSTDGVSWVAESLRQAAGGHNRQQRRRHIARWHGAWSPGVNKPIAVMGVPKGKEIMGTAIAAGDGFFAKLAQKAAGFAFDKASTVFPPKRTRPEICSASRRKSLATSAWPNKDEGAHLRVQESDRR